MSIISSLQLLFYRQDGLIQRLQGIIESQAETIDSRERDLDVVNCSLVKLEQALKTSRELCDVIREELSDTRDREEVLLQSVGELGVKCRTLEERNVKLTENWEHVNQAVVHLTDVKAKLMQEKSDLIDSLNTANAGNDDLIDKFAASREEIRELLNARETLTKELTFAREEFRSHSEGLKEILGVIHGCDPTLLIDYVEAHSV
jgi:chromosome segregation ATPase